MKHHHCHCGLRSQFHRFRAKKLGALGVVLIVGHLLFHVVECLILPAFIIGATSHRHETAHAETTHHVAAAESAEVTPVHKNPFFWPSDLDNFSISSQFLYRPYLRDRIPELSESLYSVPNSATP